METRRRGLLKLLAKAVISMATLSFLSSMYFLKKGAPAQILPEALEPVFIAPLKDIEENQAIKFDIGGTPGVLINFEGLRAFSATCPHMGCPISGKLLKSKGVLECPCHGSVFDPLTGGRISGPAPKGLERIEIEIRNNKVYAVG
jgi:Rieske Fe-S protein